MQEHIIGMSLRQGWIGHIKHWYHNLRRRWGRRIFPHGVAFYQRITDWDKWYADRHDWIRDNITNSKSQVWLDCDIVTYVDKHMMPESYVRGSIRFRRSEDLTMFLLRWG